MLYVPDGRGAAGGRSGRRASAATAAAGHALGVGVAARRHAAGVNAPPSHAHPSTCTCAGTLALALALAPLARRLRRRAGSRPAPRKGRRSRSRRCFSRGGTVVSAAPWRAGCSQCGRKRSSSRCGTRSQLPEHTVRLTPSALWFGPALTPKRPCSRVVAAAERHRPRAARHARVLAAVARRAFAARRLPRRPRAAVGRGATGRRGRASYNTCYAPRRRRRRCWRRRWRRIRRALIRLAHA